MTPLLRTALTGMTARIRECEEELNALDAELGDGDLGATLTSLARAIDQACESLPEDLGAALIELGRVIGGVSGSSFSSLLMVGLTSAGTILRGRLTLAPEDRGEVWQSALNAMLNVSGSQLGDKTMLDAVASIANAPAGVSLVEEAKRTIARYRELPCRAGRARVASDRSLGRDDSGMIAILRLMEGASGLRAAG